MAYRVVKYIICAELWGDEHHCRPLGTNSGGDVSPRDLRPWKEGTNVWHSLSVRSLHAVVAMSSGVDEILSVANWSIRHRRQLSYFHRGSCIWLKYITLHIRFNEKITGPG